MKKEKTKKPLTAREKMLRRKEKLERGASGGIHYLKDGDKINIRSAGDDEEIGLEVLTFYFGESVGGLISPASIGLPCFAMETFERLKKSKDESDMELAKQMTPKTRYIICGDLYDEKGKQIDSSRTEQLIQVPKTVYNDLVDLWLDDDEWGDMTERNNKYAVKIDKSGKNLNTNYGVRPCAKKKVDKEYTKPVDLAKKLKAVLPPYEETEDKVRQFLGNIDDSDDGDDRPGRKKKTIDKKKKKSRYKSDI